METVSTAWIKIDPMKFIQAFFLVGFSISNLYAFQSKIKHEKIGNYQIEIYLPDQYSVQRQYKTVYFNDGQMLFGKYDLNLKPTLDSLINNGHVEPIIVVGIYADQYRTEKYVPYNDVYVSKSSSKHNEYADFVIGELILWIDTHYSTKKSSNERAIFGVSFGGLNATWMTLNYPKLFGFSAGLSPSYWVSDYEIFKEAAKREKCQVFWFDIGTSEWNYYVPMIDALEKAGGTYGKDIFYLEDPQGRHNAIWWGKRVIYPLLVFAEKNKPIEKKISVEVEVIPSQSRKGVYYQRINPVITCRSGLKYSLAQKAKYTVLNTNVGHVKADGRFSFTSKNNLQVLVSYKGFEKKVFLNYQQIEGLKR